MYRMIGGDGREYGPVSPDQLRAWIADHRANGQTLVRADQDNLWQPLAAWPEFAEALRVATPPAAAPPAVPGPVSPAEALSRPAILSVGECLGQGWLLLGRHFFLLTAACLTVWLLLTASAFSGSRVAWLMGIMLSGVLYGGLSLLVLRLVRGQPARLVDVFEGFGPRMFSLMLIWIVTHLLSGIGLVCLVAPGVFLKVIWAFALIVAADQRLGLGASLELSRKVAMRQVFRLAALLGVANLPLIVFMVYRFFRTLIFALDTFGTSLALGGWTDFEAKLRQMRPLAVELELQQQVVLLLTMPFAYAVLLCAYEACFGRRPAEAQTHG